MRLKLRLTLFDAALMPSDAADSKSKASEHWINEKTLRESPPLESLNAAALEGWPWLNRIDTICPSSMVFRQGYAAHPFPTDSTVARGRSQCG